MLKLCRVDIARSQEVYNKIAAYTRRVVEALKPDAVVLFGSFARRDVNEGSDVDILVIAQFEAPLLERIKILLELNEGIGLPLEPIGYTQEEFRQMREAGNSFLEAVLETGQTLHGEIR